MRIDITDVLRVYTAVTHGHEHAATWSVAVGRGDVVCIRAHAITGKFAINASAPLTGVFILFKHQHTGAFTHDKTIAIGVPGT